LKCAIIVIKKKKTTNALFSNFLPISRERRHKSKETYHIHAFFGKADISKCLFEEKQIIHGIVLKQNVFE
jgi:hypothetical protein